MAGNTTSDWFPPVSFYFRVDFQSKFDRFQASFTEVSGLDMRLAGGAKPEFTGLWMNMPKGREYGKVTLKRPVMDDTFRKWVRKCLEVDQDKRMVAYDMVIKLLDKEGQPLASWLCSHVYPIQWTLGGFIAEKSDLATETIIMGCNRIEFVTQ